MIRRSRQFIAVSQIKLGEEELIRLRTRVFDDLNLAWQDNQRRYRRFDEMYRNFRCIYEPQDGDIPNYRVPLTQIHALGKLAIHLQGMFGKGAEVVVEPTGPSDVRNVRKLSRYYTHLVFQRIPAFRRQIALHLLHTLIYGRGIAYAPWVVETVDTPDGPEVINTAPGFYPLEPDHIITPAQPHAQSIHDFEWVARVVDVTPARLLVDERISERYVGIQENWDQLVRLAESGYSEQFAGESLQQAARDEAEGVDRLGAARSSRGTVRVIEWYGKWRMLKSGKNVDEHDFDGRHPFPSHIVVHYVPALNLIIGIQDLVSLYPKSSNKRPFVESSLVPDGTYWCMGLGELLLETEAELSSSHNLFTAGARLGATPAGWYRPGTSQSHEPLRLQPGVLYPMTDPNAIGILNIRADLEGLVVQSQQLQAYAELVTGITQQNLGRASGRPNEPRTASGQAMLLDRGNVRAFLDSFCLETDFGAMLKHFAELDQQFGSENLFFRVTEEESGGLFEVSNGGSTITMAERAGRYDFKLVFAPSKWEQDAQAERAMTLYQMDLTNPLVATNPRALWQITNRVHQLMGDEQFAHVIPMPPDLGIPLHPREEWVRILQGEDVDPNPLDNDDLHLMTHYRQIEQERESNQPDQPAIDRLFDHCAAHTKQKRQKLLMQALAQSAVQAAGQLKQQAMGAQGNATPTEQPPAEGQLPIGGSSPNERERQPLRGDSE